VRIQPAAQINLRALCLTVLAAVIAALAAAAPGAWAAPLNKAATDAKLTAPTPCESAMSWDLSRLDGAPTSITSAKLTPASGATPEYCAITGYVQPQIQFELRLPTKTWNGRYFQVGCGGFCGGVNIQNCGDVLAQDFAVSANNMGHVGNFLKDPLWGESADARRDYGRRGTHVAALASKAIVERFYGLKPAYSYFRGCSTGGREGLMEAQHYPADFDGIISGDPAFAGRLGAIVNTWDAQQLLKTDNTPVMSDATLGVLHKAVIAACDGLDGVKDGIIMDPRVCKFDVGSVQCKDGLEGADCLSALQVAAARKVYDGPRNSKGQRLFPGGETFGSEGAWKGDDRQTLADGAQRFMNFTPNPPASFSYRDFNFDTDIDKIKGALAAYDPVAPGEAPDLTAFEAKGGKLILYHGWADQGVSPRNTLDYYAQVQTRQGGLDKTRGWFRLFMVPGMFHCRGGDAPNSFDFMPSIMAWVEKGQAPDGVVATQKDKTGGVQRQRPLYAYPRYAAYDGKGDVNAAASWKAAAPKTLTDDRIDWIFGPPMAAKTGGQ
jgi:feruloyl esterase